MEDEINIFENGRRPQFLFKGSQPQIFRKWKTTSKKMMQPKMIKSKNKKIFESGRRPNFLLKKEDNLFLNGRQHQKNNATKNN